MVGTAGSMLTSGGPEVDGLGALWLAGVGVMTELPEGPGVGLPSL